MLERWTGQKGLWWLWHLSATGLLLALLLTLRQSVAEERAQTAVLRQQLEAQQELISLATGARADLTAAARFSRHAACGSLFSVAMNFGIDPWAFFEQVTGQAAKTCQEQ